VAHEEGVLELQPIYSDATARVPLCETAVIRSPVHTGPIHLCQPDGAKSCGACCGLYNWDNHSRAALQSLLNGRTDLFASTARDGDFDGYRIRAEQLAPGPRLCETIYNCEFLGFVDGGRTRVGCLLHPACNRGADMRGRSFYGRELCADHYCIGYTCLRAIEQRAVVLSLDDWYLYGLVITDVDLVTSFFAHAENRMGDRVRCDRLEDKAVLEALRGFFMLKEHWKFSAKRKVLGKYFFSQGEYYTARIEYEKRLGIRRSPFDRILVSLSSEFSRAAEVEEAEAIIDGYLRWFVAAYGAAGGGD